MKNTDYKCLCCGKVGNQDDFGINSYTDDQEEDYYICPECGSIDVISLINENSLLV